MRTGDPGVYEIDDLKSLQTGLFLITGLWMVPSDFHFNTPPTPDRTIRNALKPPTGNGVEISVCAKYTLPPLYGEGTTEGRGWGDQRKAHLLCHPFRLAVSRRSTFLALAPIKGKEGSNDPTPPLKYLAGRRPQGFPATRAVKPPHRGFTLDAGQTL